MKQNKYELVIKDCRYGDTRIEHVWADTPDQAWDKAMGRFDELISCQRIG